MLPTDWTDDTIHAVSHHYAGAVSGWSGPEGAKPDPMDMSEYIAAKVDHEPATHALTSPPSYDATAPKDDSLSPLPDRWHFKPSTRWATPTRTLPMGGPDEPVLTDEQVARWHAEGFAVVHGIWPESLIDAARAAAATLGPDEGPGGFPFSEEMQPFNDVCLHPRLLRCAAQCLGTDDVRIVQSGSGKKKYEPLDPDKHGEQMDFVPGEQGLHQGVSAHVSSFCASRRRRRSRDFLCRLFQQHSSRAAPPAAAPGDDELHHVLQLERRGGRRDDGGLQARHGPAAHAAQLQRRRRLAR